MNPSDVVGAAGNQQLSKQERQSLERRTKGLKNKSSQLSVLCDIDLCMVCYMPHADTPEIWPEDPSKVADMLQRFEKARSSGNVKQMAGMEDFRRNVPRPPDAGAAPDHDQPPREPEMTTWCDELDQLSEEELRAFACHLEKHELWVSEKKMELERSILPLNDHAAASTCSESSCAGNFPKLIEFDILKK